MTQLNTFFKEIFQYQHHFNQLLADFFIEHEDRLSERTPKLFSHCINAHRVWNARIQKEPTGTIDEVHSYLRIKELDNVNLQNTLNILDKSDLNEVLTYTNLKGDHFENSLRDVLFQVANHHTHHRGQLISDIRQQGMVPPATDYILYKRFKS
ncbi:MAG: damage-inducible protein DinB [Bacteroidetes bacterium]|nr:damage-inducible protein DinB [Bacteroidota bacterium]